MKCCICNKEIKRKGIKDYSGNNPYPVIATIDDLRCCDDCNRKYVVPVRAGWLTIHNLDALLNYLHTVSDLE